ncbi:hypothetical protein EVAR_76466_1 [Eumeta japonica]|uniref:Uncharacterized protein n=1 Tax=Eumeta variegata TaxID=151549 RepID=A0A4C1T5E4_EUMVA|nr:hypothetical protein EVAR_76466_1 [Eumeta japonica]
MCPRGVVSKIPVTWEEIEYLMDRDRANERAERGGARAPKIAHRTKGNSGICYFTPVFCKRVVFHGSRRPIFVLQPSLRTPTDTLPATSFDARHAMSDTSKVKESSSISRHKRSPVDMLVGCHRITITESLPNLSQASAQLRRSVY